MNDTAESKKKNGHEVGYGKPPVHTRFRKGKSGNPRGRPRAREKSAAKMVLDEVYRLVSVGEGKGARKMSALRAMLRAQLDLAIKGNVTAQRAVLKIVCDLERASAAAGKDPEGSNVHYIITDEPMSVEEWERKYPAVG